MGAWQKFKKGNTEYDLSHLHPFSFDHTRAATETLPSKTTRFFINFSHHCFTGHVGEDEWIYPHASDERFFCTKRYALSMNLPQLIRDILNANPYVLRTFMGHREQFFYVEQNYQDETYRVFLEISCPSRGYADVRIDIRSAYHEEPYASPVNGDSNFKLWRVIDAKLSGTALPKSKSRGRRRR